jgi:riboflavin transporter FmnP
LHKSNSSGIPLRRYYKERKSVVVAGTSVLGAFVAVLEMTRFSRIPFPLFPVLKFDIMGIPMVIAYLFFGLIPGSTTCFVSFAIISLRDPFSGFMKALAELATILGAFLILRGRDPSVSNKRKVFAALSSITLRVVVTDIATVLLFPIFTPNYYATPQAAMAIIPLVSAFNVIQGAISILGGFIVYEAVTRRMPSLKR